ncbi:MAG: PAS domain S-box protein [Deltaproteobacteria bacterium]|nr:PAS domain S-box protein [Deltaproteobacteria bacterium]
MVTPVHLIALFVLLSSGIAAAGYFYDETQKAGIKAVKEDELSAISALKVDQLVRWREEFLADAKGIMENRMVAAFLESYSKNPSAGTEEHDILAWLTSLRNNYGFSRVTLVGSSGKVFLSVPNDNHGIDLEVLELIPGVARENQPFLSDLFICQRSQEPELTLVAPILIRRTKNGEAFSFLILTIDPKKFLFPLIQSWPTPSKTSETLLVRRAGDSVVFLNQLRHENKPPLHYHILLNQEQIVAVKAVRGHEGIVEGIDYRGKRVLASVKAVPNSPWFLVTKVDEEEVFAPAAERKWLVFCLVGVLIMGSAVSIGFIWSQQHSQFFRRQYESELRRHEMAKRYEFLTQYANDIILLEDLQGNLLEANERATAAYGYGRDEILRLRIQDIRCGSVESPADSLLQSRKTGENKGIVYETLHCRKDGSSFPVEVSSRIVQLGGVNYVQSIIRDITVRREVERAMEQARDELEKRVGERTAELVRANEVLQSEIIERKRMEEALRKSESMLKLRSAQLLLAHETERKRLSLDLHDSIGQALSAIKMGVEETSRRLRRGEGGYQSLEPLIQMTQQSIEEVRRIYTNLRPSILDDLGIVATIDWFVEEMEKVHPGIRIHKEISVEEDAVPEALKIVMYRIIQESFNNLVKHSGADTATITLRRTSGRLELRVRDNGKGFDTMANGNRSSPRGGGLGLGSMRERTELSGGDFFIDSGVGQGTEVCASWPVG